MKVLPLADEAADLALTGGKGASLARLARAGLPVPAGFHVTTDAYRDFVSRDGLHDLIMEAVAGSPPDRAAAHIAALFADREMPPETAGEIRAAYARLGDDVPVAVRSSATAEDLPGMSFAGQQDTYLNVSDDALPDAVKRCWASLWTARAIAYRSANGVPQDEVAIAVVVQELVPADAAGVLFTADPVTGDRGRVVINASWGLGEAVVGGQVTPDTVVVGGPGGEIVEEHVGDKAVMTVRVPGGTREEPVPEELRRRPVLDRDRALRLARLGTRIEELYGTPMDVEWTLRDGKFAVVQARPITGLRQPVEEWNDSLIGDYLWTGSNLGEAIPDVMTPCTWSLVQIFIGEAMASLPIPGFPMVGNIGGRFYMNLSVVVSVARAVGMGGRLGAVEQVFGKLPPGLDVPLLPVSRWRIVKALLPTVVTLRRRVTATLRDMPAFLATARRRNTELRERIAAAGTPGELAELWEKELLPYYVQSCRVLEAAGRQGGNTLVMTRDRLRKMVGETDAEAMLTGVGADGELASLGPIIGLRKLAGGEIDRETFARDYGHRGPHEFEVSLPRPGEDPAWIDAQLAASTVSGERTGALLERQREAREAAWRRFERRSPGRAAKTRDLVKRWNAIVRDRETARSEVVRAFWALRAFVLRAGELTGHGDDLFFLSIQEILAVLRGGDAPPPARVAIRRATYERYAALPPYPMLIVGRFDPVRWAADPARRSDVFDARGDGTPVSDTVTGFPGAPGVVEGVARVIATPEEGDRLAPGEILVTTLTNIGWTPMFPRAAAVVTDMGAPLSHASIVARELGIPAVVGTGNATMRLRDGARIRVDGERGTVELLTP
ncbi:pyruvate,water dikinase [Streptosporangium becharense]|uniref:Pyruvate,water dikinase n=1 Tax=Streptosporangium becharense TaxID=1816182 RepID=A0A7W9IDE3_9ACTN|nr:PEP/pyruvate-binding domain-containing protein [Streptosporangium becharense]MBB2912085.1 pyruvate,water dikinase [Streptosporangium becharense]MBB5818632.1 pyruvate,water dikinase [Streptosporangium becharense]